MDLQNWLRFWSIPNASVELEPMWSESVLVALVALVVFGFRIIKSSVKVNRA